MFKKYTIWAPSFLLLVSLNAGNLEGSETENLWLSPQITNNESRRMFDWETQTISFSPDGNVIASGEQKGFIQLWSIQGYLLRTLPWTGGGGVKFSNSGKLLASFLPSGDVEIWNPENGEQVKKFKVPLPDKWGARRIDFNPDDSLIAISGNNFITFWDINKNVVASSIRAAQGNSHGNGLHIRSMSFVEDGRAIVAYSSDTVKVWDLQGRVKAELHINGLTDVFVSKADGKIIATSEDTVSIWNLKGKLLNTFPYDNRPTRYGPSAPTQSTKVAYLRNIGAIVTANRRGFQIYDMDGRLQRAYLPQPPNPEAAFWRRGAYPMEIQVSLDGKKLAARSDEGTMGVWDMTPIRMKEFFVKKSNLVNDFEFFPGDNIVTSSMKVFDRTGKMQSDLNFEANYMTASPDGRLIAVASVGGEVRLFDSSWRLLNKFPASVAFNQIFRTPLSFSPDSRKLALAEDAAIVIRETATGQVLARIPHDMSQTRTQEAKPVTELRFMPDGQTLLVGYFVGPLSLINSESNEKTTILKVLQWRVLNCSAFTASGNFGVPLWDSVKFWDTAGQPVASISLSNRAWLGTDRVKAIAIDPNDKYVVVGRERGGVELFDFTTGKIIKELSSHLTDITRLKFSSDGAYLFSSSSDGVLRVLNTKNWNSVSIVSSTDNEWIIYAPDGYFDASPHGGELLAMVNGLKAYGVEQFAARNNRPDLILERMGLGTPDLMAHYQIQYQKRLKKLGLSEANLSGDLHVPEAQIVKTERTGKFIKIGFVLRDGKYSLKRYNMFVNNVPVLGSIGKTIRGNTFEGSEKIELSSGTNKIELSVINEAGVESYRDLIYAEYDGKEKGSLYYLGFGVSSYKNPALNLNYADKDAKDLESAILRMQPAYSKVHVKTIINSEVTAESIKKAKNFLKGATVDDTVVLFLAGHGGYDKGKSPRYYYLPYAADPGDLTGTGVVFEEIESLLSDIKPRRKLFLLDTCESGELEEDIFAQYYALADARGLKARTHRKPVKTRGALADKGRGYLLEKDRFIYNDLARRSGAIVFSSSRGNEMSYESSAIKNGFFSREIINAFTSGVADSNRDGRVSVDELRAYVSRAVAKETFDLQHPTVDRDNLSQKIEFQIPHN